MLPVIAKTIGIWLLMILAAIINGLVRKKIRAPSFGSQAAPPVSVFLMSAIIFAVTCCTIPFIGGRQNITFIQVGLL